MSSTTVTREHWISSEKGQLFAQDWTPAENTGEPILLLHDSLGCVTLWRDFPQQLARTTGRQVIAYDRLGFGRSDQYPGALPLDFIDEEARTVFPLLQQLFGFERCVVFGHSVGGAMAVACVAQHPQACAALISESAQAFVEHRTRDGIRAAEQEFAREGQLQRLQRYHGDKAFWVLRAWVDTWLGDDFSDWNLDAELAQVKCPILSLHGEQDEYGSAAHPQRFTSTPGVPTMLRLLADCGHVPHREQQPAVLQAVAEFFQRYLPQAPSPAACR
ncbi:alpha/beta fold hydrolase [Pseudomonas nitroreducens]|uniref:alpha/beta fold hydrolase n=1 Tax=Pseudomonas nitroreducens TaxID=46680 RepID=UPI00265A91AE|nr:alpha/beta hydrolase [Pseudomonas nitroreducens]MCP1648202.1 pimeloyl-ACP methyl ester carboxylesterase [Pseudomonas nitroreducens]MCP1686777.1 pimeloyl-ACP methyl ester carboxylesterase [Pseudomonas nitroreducens]